MSTPPRPKIDEAHTMNERRCTTQLGRAGVLAIAALLWIGATADGASAQVPGQLTNQGHVLDAAMNPLEGEEALTFAIYDDAGVLVWTETQVVSFEGGYYAVTLGSTTPIPLEVFAHGEGMALGIRVGDDQELEPRLALGSVPYAFKASVADNAVGDITPRTVRVGEQVVIDAEGRWVGDPSGLQGPPGVSPSAEDVAAALETNSDLREALAAFLVAEHAEALRGLRGEPGPQGEPGLQGAPGERGLQGADADPAQVAAALLMDEAFRQAVALVLVQEHAEALRGPAGRDASPDQVAAALGQDDGFIDQVGALLATEFADALRGAPGSGCSVERVDGGAVIACGDGSSVTVTDGVGGADTAAQVLSKLITVDGAGSGLDADRLDGQEGAYYASQAALDGVSSTLTSRVDQLYSFGAGLEQQINDVVGDVSALDERVTGLEASEAEVRGDIASLQSDVDGLSEVYASRSDLDAALDTINALQARLSALEESRRTGGLLGTSQSDFRAAQTVEGETGAAAMDALCREAFPSEPGAQACSELDLQRAVASGSYGDTSFSGSDRSIAAWIVTTNRNPDLNGHVSNAQNCTGMLATGFSAGTTATLFKNTTPSVGAGVEADGDYVSVRFDRSCSSPYRVWCCR